MLEFILFQFHRICCNRKNHYYSELVAKSHFQFIYKAFIYHCNYCFQMVSLYTYFYDIVCNMYMYFMEIYITVVTFVFNATMYFRHINYNLVQKYKIHPFLCETVYLDFICII